MRQRIERRLRKAIRAASHAQPGLAQRCAHRQRVAGALSAVTCDQAAPVAERKLAAKLLSRYQRDSFRPLLDHFWASDVDTAWQLVYLGNLRLSAVDEAKLVELVRHDPAEHKRSAVLELLAYHGGSTAHRHMIEVLEDRGQNTFVRGRAAEALCTMYRPKPEVIDALCHSLRDPQPDIRFWSAFALGGLVQFRPHLHPMAIEALLPLIDDPGDEGTNYWSVGREAQAMLEYMIPERAAQGQRERKAILGDPNAPADLRRWAECYDHTPRS